MDWDSFAHFIHMDGHGFYVWMAYSVTLIAVILEIFCLKSRRAKAVNRLTRESRSVRAAREQN